MSKTMADLILDTLPRLTKAPRGISIYQAANSLQSLLYKKLLELDSDILASGDLSVTIPALGYYASMPADFVSMAEKPYPQDDYTDFMYGTVTSYDSVTGVLVASIVEARGSDTLTSWTIAKAGALGAATTAIGTSVTSMSPATGTKTLTITTGLTLPAASVIFIYPSTSSLGFWQNMYKQQFQPEGLREDDHEDYQWWDWYGNYGEGLDAPCQYPTWYKIIGSTIYVRPKPQTSILIKGRYFASPTEFTAVTDTIPYPLFYEVFKEGVVSIIMKGLSIPEADPTFFGFIKREVDNVTWSRQRALPRNRTDRRNFI